MEHLGRLFTIGIPVFALMIFAEKWYGYIKGNDTVPWMDALSSSYSGITMMVRMLIGYGLVLVPYNYMVQHLALVNIQPNWLLYAVAFVVVDFKAYWGHRLAHRINLFWNRHLIHHSSEEFNLACALRQTISDFVNFFFFLSVPLALLGISPQLVALLLPLHTFAQYWYHTRLIGKLGFLEYILVTPSHHRVHHALNPQYIDKNYSAVFIVWDKIFGTFQAELEDVPPVYGITRPVRSYNPITINFDHLLLLIKDAWRAENLWDKLTIWVRPTGWRPAGFNTKYPVAQIADPYGYTKYNPPHTAALVLWSLVQFFTLLFTVIYIIQHISIMGNSGLWLLGLFVFVQVYSATELMNHNKLAPAFALTSTLVCIGLYMADNTWFGMASVWAGFPPLFVTYFALQALLAFWFAGTFTANGADVSFIAGQNNN